MAKKALGSTFQVEKKRESYHHAIGWVSFFTFLILGLACAYVFACMIYQKVAISGKGYMFPFEVYDGHKLVCWSNRIFLFKGTWAANIPYFDEISTYSIFDFVVNGEFVWTTLYRWLVVIGIIVVCITITLLVHDIMKHSLKKKYARVYLNSLSNISSNLYNLSFTAEKVKVKKNDRVEKQLSNALIAGKVTSLVKYDFDLNGSDFVEASQYYFKSNDGKSLGLQFTSKVINCENSDFIQFRNFGSFNVKEIDSKLVSKFRCPELKNKETFVCYSNANRELLNIIDEKFFVALDKLSSYVNCGISLTLNKDILELYFDKFELVLARKFSKKLKDDVLEVQAISLSTLIENIKETIVSLCSKNTKETFIEYKEVETE